MTFLFFEDKDYDTGHGWRFMPEDELGKLKIRFRLGGKEEYCFEDENYNRIYPDCSYFWITQKDHYEEHGDIQDNIRTSDICAVHPDFLGHDDMENHFEFKMTPNETRTYLLSIGIKDGGNLK